MAYIQPNTIVKILKNCPLDKAMEHSLYFTSENAQITYFESLAKYSFTAQTYQRYNKDTIRIKEKCDNLYDCNYMMFKNTNYGSKWFYAFIIDVTYINDNCTEIQYKIDPLQSFYFDYEFENSLVEREHTRDDTLGKYLVDEQLETGDKIVEAKYDYTYNYMLGGIILSKPIKLVSTSQSISSFNKYEGYAVPGVIWANQNVFKIKLSYPNEDETSITGISNGLYIYYGFPISKNDVNNYWNVNSEYTRFDMQDPCTYGQDISAPVRTNNPVTFNDFIEIICNGHFKDMDDNNITENNIIGTFQYPAEISRLAYQTAGYLKGYENGVSTGDITNSAIDLPSSFGNYSPKNNKLFTSPYMNLVVSNNNGEIAEYKYELFEDSRGTTQGGIRSGGINFRWIGAPIPQFPLTIIPKDYRSLDEDYENSIKLFTNIEALYSGNEYAAWKQRNSNLLGFSMLSSGLNLLSGVGGMFKSYLPFVKNTEYDSAHSLATSSAHNIINTLATISDKKNTPPNVYGKFNNECFLTGIKRFGFTFYSMRIKEEFAKIIDDYFTKYGYKVNVMKKPSIRNRSNWTFLKTVGCKISGTNGLTAEWEETIEKIYDRGVTFWTNPLTMMNYNLNNVPLDELAEI